MVVHRVLKRGEAAVVKERRLQGEVAKRRRAEAVAVFGVAGEVFQAEVLAAAGAREHEIPRPHAEDRRDLRDAEGVHLKVAEHLVRRPAYGVATDAPRLAEEE